jgi:hypothetical protein
MHASYVVTQRRERSSLVNLHQNLTKLNVTPVVVLVSDIPASGRACVRTVGSSSTPTGTSRAPRSSSPRRGGRRRFQSPPPLHHPWLLPAALLAAKSPYESSSTARPLPYQPVHDHMHVVQRAGSRRGRRDPRRRCAVRAWRETRSRGREEEEGEKGGYGEVINKDLGTGIPCADGFN